MTLRCAGYLGWLWCLLSVATVRAEQVVISEIMYHPPATRPEFVELYNQTVTPLDIARWRLAGGVSYEFPDFSTNAPGLTFLKPFERIVLCGANAAALRAAYRMPESVRVYGPWTGKLSNSGERITLKDKNGVTACTVKFGTRGHWPVAADGAGHSLVLRDSNRSVDDWRNWTASELPGGTPGTVSLPARETPAASPEVDLNLGIPLVDYGSSWRYEASGRELGASWRETTFDDSKWASGRGLLGFEDAPLPTPGIQTPLSRRGQMTCYFRTRFVFNGDLKNARFALDQIVDDGAVYYLNGKEIGRSRMATGGVFNYNTPALTSVPDATEELSVFPISGALFLPGTNVLAVEVHQSSATSLDLVFGARLRVSTPFQAGIVINEIFPDPVNSGFVEFFNATTNMANLRGWFLTDDAGHLRKFPIRGDVLLPPGGLGAIGFGDAAFAVTNPAAVFLVNPDGATVENAVMVNFSSDPRALGRKPAGGRSWFRFPEPSRGLPNVGLSGEAARLNEVHFKKDKVDWVELFNPLRTGGTTQGLFLSSRRDFSDKEPLNAPLAAGGCASWNVSFPVRDREVTLYVVNAAGVVLDGRVFTPPVSGECWQAFPDGGGEWFSASKPSRNETNNPPHNTDIVINEIMFDPPSALTNASQFIELFNRGKKPVDLSGWQFEEAVQFKFPNGVKLAAGSYLVIAADTNRLRAACGNLPLVGNFKGKLSHGGELIRLVDRAGNLVNQVEYHSGGDWPELAAGLGSSMELINPGMDNSRASAWRDSDERGKASPHAYSCEGKYEELHVKGAPSDFKELHFHLVGDGHVVLENIWFGKKGSDKNYVLNGGRMSEDGASVKGWLAQGNHAQSFITNGQLHIVSDGHGDSRANRVEIDVTGMTKGETCELKFNALWVSGKPRLIAQTWEHSIAGSFLVQVPQNLGSPGAVNSRFIAVPPPQVGSLSHSPAVPRSTNTVAVTAKVFSIAPLTSVQVFHRLDNDKADGVWTNTAMRDDGLAGDAMAGDAIFTGELPRRNSGQVIQFFVQATATNGQSCLLPRGGAVRPALYVVDDRAVPLDLRTTRFIVSARDLNAIADGNTPRHGFKYPRHSNHYFNSTFITNEEEIYYGGEIRNSGSPWTRGGGLDRPKFKLPNDRRFRSHEHFYYDNDPAGGNFHNRVTRYWLYLLGHPVGENEIIRVVVNNFGIDLREDTEPVHNDLLNRNFAYGSKGQLYRIDDEWWFTDNWDRDQRDADFGYKGSDNPGRYRTEWMKRSNETEDDFTDLIAFFKTISAGKFTDVDQLLDVDAVLKYTVVRGYIADWDTFTMGRGKNAFFFQRATDGKFQFLQWDSDLALGDANSGFYGGRVQGWLERPHIRRLFNYYLAELHERYTKNSARFQAWLQADEDASNSYSPNPSVYLNWCNNREAAVLRELGASYKAVFKINPVNTANTVTNHTVTLTGMAPCTIYTLELAPQPKAKPEWKDVQTWKFADVPVSPGTNVFVVRGVDEGGRLLQESRLSIVRTNTGTKVP